MTDVIATLSLEMKIIVIPAQLFLKQQTNKKFFKNASVAADDLFLRLNNLWIECNVKNNSIHQLFYYKIS